MDILNVEEQLEKMMNEKNKAELIELATEFKRSHYPNVLEKAQLLEKKYQDDPKLIRLLSIIRVVSHAQLGEFRHSSELLASLYEKQTDKNSNTYILLGELASMCNYKLARRIMSTALKQLKLEEVVDQNKYVKVFLVLGEAEENLNKFRRAIKYYNNCLTLVAELENKQSHFVLFLHYKIGMLHMTLDQTKEAIQMLEKTISLAGNGYDDLKINSLISIAKLFMNSKEDEKALPRLQTALTLLNHSRLKNTLIHAEALMETAFYYFEQASYEQAIPYYEKTFAIYQHLSERSPRKFGMIYMQYAYCLANKTPANKRLAGKYYELAIEKLEKSSDHELLENALADVIAFFDNEKHNHKKRLYENKFVKMKSS